jgi:hypothetical protein
VSIEHTSLRVGDVFRGPRGGLKEIMGWDPQDIRRHEVWARFDEYEDEEEGKDPERFRGLLVRIGKVKGGTWLAQEEFLRWLGRSERVRSGDGALWPYNDCGTCHGIGLVPALDDMNSPLDYLATKDCPECMGKNWPIEHTTLRVGDVFRGPRGGLREICAWDSEQMREIEAWAHHENAPAPTAARGVFVRLGRTRAGRWMSLASFLMWLRRTDRVSAGDGMSWPYNDCRTCHGIGLYAALTVNVCPDCKGTTWERT